MNNVKNLREKITVNIFLRYYSFKMIKTLIKKKRMKLGREVSWQAEHVNLKEK